MTNDGHYCPYDLVLSNMKKTVTATILTLLTFLSYGQNWQFFPLDNLRCYINPLQDTMYLQGIDFREYKNVNADTTIIDFGMFSRIYLIPKDWNVWPGPDYVQVPSGNSNIGNKAIVTPESTVLIFTESVDKKVQPDTLTLLHTSTIGANWTALNNSTLTIEAKLASVVPAGSGDSIKTISLHITHKPDRKSRNIDMKVSRLSGLLSFPSFYDLLENPSDLQRITPLQLLPYKEFTEEEFFRIKPGTELHYTDFDSDLHKLDGHWTFNGYEDSVAHFTVTQAGLKSYFIATMYPPYQKFSHSAQISETKKVVLPRKTGTHIVNHIPGKIRPISFYLDSSDAFETTTVPHYSLLCDRLKVTIQGEWYLKHLWTTIGDTAFYGITWDGEDFASNYLQNVGQIHTMDYTYGRYGGHRTEWDWKQIHIPGECEIAVNSWRLTSVQEVADAESAVTLYPNPASDYINVNSEHLINEVTAVSTTGIATPLEINNATINTAPLTNGTYVLIMKTDQGDTMRRLIVVLRGK